MRYRVSHIIHVDYDSPVRMAHFNLRLQPILWPGQTVSDYDLSIDPLPNTRQDRLGAFPFNLTRIEIARPIGTLEIRSTFIATVDDAQLNLADDTASIRELAELALDQGDLGPWSPVHYVYPSPLLPQVPAIADWSRAALSDDAPALASA